MTKILLLHYKSIQQTRLIEYKQWDLRDEAEVQSEEEEGGKEGSGREHKERKL